MSYNKKCLYLYRDTPLFFIPTWHFIVEHDDKYLKSLTHAKKTASKSRMESAKKSAI